MYFSLPGQRKVPQERQSALGRSPMSDFPHMNIFLRPDQKLGPPLADLKQFAPFPRSKKLIFGSLKMGFTAFKICTLKSKISFFKGCPIPHGGTGLLVQDGYYMLTWFSLTLFPAILFF